jgi:hypothetical protein
MLPLLVTANIPSSPVLVTLMMEVIHSSGTQVLTRATQTNIPEDDILRSHRRENLKSYKYKCIDFEYKLYLCFFFKTYELPQQLKVSLQLQPLPGTITFIRVSINKLTQCSATHIFHYFSAMKILSIWQNAYKCHAYGCTNLYLRQGE